MYHGYLNPNSISVFIIPLLCNTKLHFGNLFSLSSLDLASMSACSKQLILQPKYSSNFKDRTEFIVATESDYLADLILIILMNFFLLPTFERDCHTCTVFKVLIFNLETLNCNYDVGNWHLLNIGPFSVYLLENFIARWSEFWYFKLFYGQNWKDRYALVLKVLQNGRASKMSHPWASYPKQFNFLSNRLPAKLQRIINTVLLQKLWLIHLNNCLL